MGVKQRILLEPNLGPCVHGEKKIVEIALCKMG